MIYQVVSSRLFLPGSLIHCMYDGDNEYLQMRPITLAMYPHISISSRMRTPPGLSGIYELAID